MVPRGIIEGELGVTGRSHSENPFGSFDTEFMAMEIWCQEESACPIVEDQTEVVFAKAYATLG